jgi:hypothetical protein
MRSASDPVNVSALRPPRTRSERRNRRRLALETHRLTARFPPEERYGLSAELRKTARSVASNIAEGHKRASTSSLHAEVERMLDALNRKLRSKAAPPA